MPEPERFRRGDARERSRRDLDRLARRANGNGFWRSLALIGSVGWPIVLLATGGALLGRRLDTRFQTGVRFTLILLTVGTIAGSVIAYRALRENGS
jgi:predicted F0F1-ATPase subunit